jgi:hypothetical protein
VSFKEIHKKIVKETISEAFEPSYLIFVINIFINIRGLWSSTFDSTTNHPNCISIDYLKNLQHGMEAT